MKLSELIKNLDKSERNQDKYLDLQPIASEFYIDEYFDYSDEIKITAYWLSKWYDSGSFIGDKIYFLGNEPIALSSKHNGKSDEKFTWFSYDLAKKVRDYLLSLIPKNDLKIMTCDVSNTELGNHYKLHFNAEVLDWSKARYKGEPIELIHRIKETPDFGMDTKSKIKVLSTGEEKNVDIKELDFLYHIKENSSNEH